MYSLNNLFREGTQEFTNISNKNTMPFRWSLNARIQPLKYSTGQASQLYRNLSYTNKQPEEKLVS